MLPGRSCVRRAWRRVRQTGPDRWSRSAPAPRRARGPRPSSRRCNWRTADSISAHAQRHAASRLTASFSFPLQLTQSTVTTFTLCLLDQRSSFRSNSSRQKVGSTPVNLFTHSVKTHLHTSLPCSGCEQNRSDCRREQVPQHSCSHTGQTLSLTAPDSSD